MKKWLALALVLLLALPALAGCAQDTPAASPDAQGGRGRTQRLGGCGWG